MATAQDYLDAGLPRLGVFLQIALPDLPNIRLWLGVGDIEPGTNAVDTTGALYRGLGELIDVPAFSHLFDASADRVEFSIRGIPETVLSEIAPNLAAAQAAVQGQQIYVGWAAMDETWQLMTAIAWEWFGFVDLIHVRHSGPADPVAPHTIGIALSCGDWMTGRRRAGLSFLTDHDQKRRAQILNPTFPPDRFADRVGKYNQGVEKNWPAV